MQPLAQTLARIRTISGYLKPEFGIPANGNWVSITDDFAPGAPWITSMIAAEQARLRTTSAAIIGSTLLQNYQWPIIPTVVACYLFEQRVPDLTPTNTRVHFTAEHQADALALLGGRFSALPGDPAAEHPDATIVPDRAALRDAMRTGIESHFEVVIEHICAVLGCKPRGLWLNVADAVANALIWLAQQHAAFDLTQIEAEVDAVIRVPGSPLNNRQVGLIQLSYGENRQLFLRRATCCYWYKTEGGEYCLTCPHRTAEDRQARLLAYMAQKYTQKQRHVQEEVTA